MTSPIPDCLYYTALLLLLTGTPVSQAQDFVGSESCAGCHQAAYERWTDSHHFRAMAEAGPDTVLGNFDDVVFEQHGERSRFFREADAWRVETTGASGEPEIFTITHTFGFEPLQQYLTELDDGRLQALSIAWDSRPAAEGGQRWFHLYDEPITLDDPLHWTASFQNANSRCISCHTTGYDKGYDADTESYDPQWTGVNVGCEACHGPGSGHLAWAVGDEALADRGLVNRLGNVWEPEGGARPIPESQATTMSPQIQVCAGCHSRRNELQPRDLQNGYHDNYSISPLREGLYHADGQILDEVYVAGSFLQSRMFQEHVSCGNCHEPHSNQLRIEGNGLCLQCHAAEDFQSRDHLLHPVDSTGGQCVNCHMPETTYMQVDPRRDHGLKIPDPFASLQSGTPNACTGCHEDRDDRWAADILSDHFGQEAPYYDHIRLIAGARAGDSSVASDLLAMAEDGSHPGMLRGIALIEGARFPSQQHMGTVLRAVNSDDPIVRASAAMALDYLDVATRFQYLDPLLDDPAKAVRMTVARQLSGLPMQQLSPDRRARFEAVMTEYEQSLRFNADMPESMSDLGLHHVARGDLEAAEAALSHARQLSPGYLPVLLNLADVYRAQGRDADAEPLLREAIERYPDSADAHHALGLLYVRTGRTAQSVAILREAAGLSPDNPRYALVYGLALAETGQRDQAIEVLETASQRFPDNANLRNSLRSLQSR